MSRTLLATVAALAMLAGAARAQTAFRVHPAESESHDAVLRGTGDGTLRLSRGEETVEMPLIDLHRLVRKHPVRTDEVFGLRLEFLSGSRLTVALAGGEDERVTCRPFERGGDVSIPLRGLRSFRWRRPSGPRVEELDGDVEAPDGETDLLWVRSRGDVMRLRVAIRRVDAEGVRVVWEGRERTISHEKVEGAILANPAVALPDGPTARVRTVRGDVLVGTLAPADGGRVGLRLPCGTLVPVPPDLIERLDVRGGRLEFLSDLDPVVVEETPWFIDNHWPWRRDGCVSGGPLKVGGKTFEKGLGTHSRCVLGFDLGGKFRRFRVLVGLDDTAPGMAHAVVRVMVDGKAVTAGISLQAGGNASSPLDLDVAGAKRLTLVVEYGEACDIGDRVDWCDARLLR